MVRELELGGWVEPERKATSNERTWVKDCEKEKMSQV